MLPSVFLEDDKEFTEMVTHRFSLLCKKNDIRYQKLLMAISYEDFPHPMQILKGFPKHEVDIYFINMTKKMIFHLCDDRGCDVVKDLFPLYQACNEWILDYDCEKIEQTINSRC